MQNNVAKAISSRCSRNEDEEQFNDQQSHPATFLLSDLVNYSGQVFIAEPVVCGRRADKGGTECNSEGRGLVCNPYNLVDRSNTDNMSQESQQRERERKKSLFVTETSRVSCSQDSVNRCLRHAQGQKTSRARRDKHICGSRPRPHQDFICQRKIFFNVLLLFQLFLTILQTSTLAHKNIE